MSVRQAARRIEAILEDNDSVARIGGDEFVVLCEATTSARAQQLADVIVGTFRRAFAVQGSSAMATASALFTDDMRAIAMRRVEIESGLHPAFRRGELRLYYQPLLDVLGTLTDFEALARWPMPGRGIVPPSEFIPVAEASGLIGALTDWALDQGLAALAGWRRDRAELNLTLLVNMAASQLSHDGLQPSIDDALTRYSSRPTLCAWRLRRVAWSPTTRSA